MPSSVAGFHCIGFTRLVPRLLGQPRRMALSKGWGSLRLPLGSSLCSTPADLQLAGRRSQFCSGASSGPVWVLHPLCPTMRQSLSIRAPPSLCWPLRRSESYCSSDSKSTTGKMSSSSSTSNGQGKPKPKSPFGKRGSLQSTTIPGEWA